MLTRNYWETSSGNTIFAIKFSVSHHDFHLRQHLILSCRTVASKCGFNILNGGDGSVTNSASHIKDYIDGTIERLGFTPDLYYLHRIDPSSCSSFQEYSAQADCAQKLHSKNLFLRLTRFEGQARQSILGSLNVLRQPSVELTRVRLHITFFISLIC